MIKNTSALLINEPPLQVLPSLAVAIGLDDAIFIQQLHYWLQRSTNERDGRRWVYNSYPEWKDSNFPFWSARTIERIVARLEKRDLILTSSTYNKSAVDRTKWYTINYEVLDKLAESITPDWQIGKRQTGSVLPETTHKTTKRKTDISSSWAYLTEGGD